MSHSLNNRGIAKVATEWIVKAPIWAYRLTLSALLGNACRYHPTCSAYALEAIDEHGPLWGSILAIKRISRCHPWGNSGLDLVPSATDRKSMSSGTKRAI